MPKRILSDNVFDEALRRLEFLYRRKDRVVVSFSGGKDSGVCVELAILAARKTKSLPVDVVMRDEEIMFPGTFEYAERIAARPEVRFHWLIANQPIINAYNRLEPFFWTFDPLLRPSQWVRTPPAMAQHISDKVIDRIVMPERFPPGKSGRLVNVIGLRVSESLSRRFGLYTSGGYLTQPNEFGVVKARPIYDWVDGDIWRAIHKYQWDYNSAYDAMHKMGVSKSDLRITPPTLTSKNSANLRVASRAWPRWFDRVCERLPGVRLVVLFGVRAIEPHRKLGQTWKELYHQECLNAPAEWIRLRSETLLKVILTHHRRHSSADLPDSFPCRVCSEGAANLGSWKNMTLAMYRGDPFCMQVKKLLPYVDPEEFRPGAGKWEAGGSPSF